MALDSREELQSIPIRPGVAGAGIAPLKDTATYDANDLVQLGGYYRGIDPYTLPISETKSQIIHVIMSCFSVPLLIGMVRNNDMTRRDFMNPLNWIKRGK